MENLLRVAHGDTVLEFAIYDNGKKLFVNMEYAEQGISISLEKKEIPEIIAWLTNIQGD